MPQGRYSFDDVDKPKATDGKPSDSGAVTMAATAAAVPALANAALNVATSPAVPRGAATFGKVMGAVAPIVGGASAGGPGGAALGATQAAKGAWVGGKTGWFTGKLAQNLMIPVAKVMQAIEPYAQTLSTLSGAQGVLDLAQMAEPNRKDIGFFGMSTDTSTRDKIQAFTQQWDAFMKDYPKAIGKDRWNALNPNQRVEAWHVFMNQQQSGAKDVNVPAESK